MRHDRDEYKWVRDITSGHNSYRRPVLQPKKRTLRLVDFLGIVLVGVSLAFIALTMFK